MIPRLRVATLLVALGLAGAVPASAQVLGGLNYFGSNPAGDLNNDFISNNSWIGLSVEGRRFVNPNVTIGALARVHRLLRNRTDPLFFPRRTVSGEHIAP